MNLETIMNTIQDNIDETDKYCFSIIIRDIKHNNYQFYSSWLFCEEVKYILLSLLSLNIPLYIDIRANKLLETSNDCGFSNHIMYNKHIILIENSYNRFSDDELKRFNMEFKLRNGNRFIDDRVFLIPSSINNIYRNNSLNLVKVKELMLQENEITQEIIDELINR